jgi:NodT family efflux transporter outer membrane factor (OMF) lipoprotein
LATPPEDAALVDAALPAGTEIPAAWSSDGAPTSAVGGNWVASFRDPNMTGLVAEALRNNPDLKAAAAQLDAALQAVAIAGAPILPSVGATAGGQQSRDLTENSTSSIGGAELLVSWEVDLWGKLRSGQAGAAASAAAIANDAVYANQSIAATVARTWISMIEIAKLIAVAEEIAGVYENLLTLAQQKEAAGQVSDFDVVQTRARLSAARAAIPQLRISGNEATAALEVLLGRYPSLGLRSGTRYPPMPQRLSAGLPLSLLDRRPDIAAARNQVVAAFYSVEVAKLARLPGVSLAASGGRLFDPDIALLGANPDFLRAGVGLLQPIFEGGALEAQVIEMTAEQAAATALYGQTVLEAYAEVETRLANEKLLRERLASLRAALADAEEAVRLGQDNYLAGTIDMTELLTLQQLENEAKVEVVQSEAALLTNRVALYLALGEPY